MCALVYVLGAGVSARAVRAQQPLSSAPNSRVVTVSRPEHWGSEPGIAIDPRNSARLIAAYGGPYVAWSADSGRTFTIADGTIPPGGKGGGDVSVAFDDTGAAYLSYLTSEGLGSASYWAHHAGKSGIWVQRSADGGRTWPTPPVPVKIWPNPRDTAPQMVDMSRIWVDANPASPHRGNLYVAWINWELDRSIIQFSRSADHGASWSVPMKISAKAGLRATTTAALWRPSALSVPMARCT